MQLALDSHTNDLIKPDGGGVERVTEGRYTVQNVRSRLRTNLGGWKLDSRVGWLSVGLPNNFTDFERNPDLFDIETRARVIILETSGVLSINSMSVEYTADRTYTITFEATTIYGEINLTVPWG